MHFVGDDMCIVIRQVMMPISRITTDIRKRKTGITNGIAMQNSAVALQDQHHTAEAATQLTGLGNHLLGLVKDSWRQLLQLVLDFFLQRRFCSTDLDACPRGTALGRITSS